MKKAVLKAGFVGAAVSLLFFCFGVPYLPEGWTPIIEKISVILTHFGWTILGFILGGAIMALIGLVSRSLKMASGNWTRLGR
jgi:uncharacterized membrane protein